LSQLDNDVIVYRSLGDFEEGRKLASVSLGTFQAHLREATGEVASILPRLNDSRLKTEISNALACYRDGAYWWEKIYQPRVIHVSEFRSNDKDVTPSASFFHANLPYTVAIHWRQANKHLQRAIRRVA
jgi:sugar lactone lactonase YvrE